MSRWPAKAKTLVTVHDLFRAIIAIHIVAGAPGLVIFWVPVLSKKGWARHRLFGRIFLVLMMVAASCAIALSVLTLIAPMETHPHLVAHPDFPEFSNPALVRCVFGWMMLFLGILTINLAWSGYLAIRHKRAHARIRVWHNWLWQVLLIVAAINCGIQGLLIDYPLTLGMSLLGFGGAGNNIWFLTRKQPPKFGWLAEHIKMHVGTGISVYTAFFAFGAVRIAPDVALNPILWAVPLVVGLGIIGYHLWKLPREKQRPGGTSEELTREQRGSARLTAP